MGFKEEKGFGVCLWCQTGSEASTQPHPLWEIRRAGCNERCEAE